MTDSAAPDAIRAVATLSDDVRRRLYTFARLAGRPVSRDEAAEAAGVSRKLAAFHLDKLVEAGLLRAVPLSEGVRRVGRPPKAYEPADGEVQVSIPARRHEVLAEILAQAVCDEEQHASAKAAASRAAYERGVGAGVAVRGRLRPRQLSGRPALTLAEGALAEHGFEPRRVNESCIRLSNCPFHPLAKKMPELVCGLNHAFVRGMVDGMEATTVDAVLAPSAGECCVELRGKH